MPKHVAIRDAALDLSNALVNGQPLGYTDELVEFAGAILDRIRVERDAVESSPLQARLTLNEFVSTVARLDADQLVYVAAALRDRFNDGPGTIKSARYLAAATLAELLVPAGDPAADGTGPASR